MKTVLTCLLALPLCVLAQSETPQTRVGWFAEHSDLDKGYANWREQGLRIQRVHAPRHASELVLSRTSRFGLKDTQIEASHVMPLSPAMVLSAQLGASPTHRVLPRHMLGASLQTEFAPGWLLHTGARYTRYEQSRVERVGLMLERYVGDFSHALEWAPSRSQGERSDTYTWRSSWYPGEGRSLGLIASTGEEVAEIGAGATTVAQVRSLALVARWRIDPLWSLTGAWARTHQGDFYNRTSVNVGVQRDF